MSGASEALAKVVGVLDDVAVQIRELEREAETLLHEQGDSEGSAANLRRKAELLRDLPDAVDDLLAGLDDAAREAVEEGVDGFSTRGGMALGQGSVFWMKNLLYPEDYKDGDPNDLERFIAGLVSS